MTVVKSATVGGMRQIRCPKCQGMAVPSRNSKGEEVCTCGQCGTSFSSRKF